MRGDSFFRLAAALFFWEEGRLGAFRVLYRGNRQRRSDLRRFGILQVVEVGDQFALGRVSVDFSSDFLQVGLFFHLEQFCFRVLELVHYVDERVLVFGN